MAFRAPLFLITGFGWLLLSALLGLALLLSMVTGSSLPPALRTLHPHGALVGGAVQVVAALILRHQGRSRPLLYAALNGGTLALLAGLGAGQAWLAAGAGLAVLLALLALMGEAMKEGWYSGTAWLMLLLSLAMGGAMALHLLPQTWLGQGRLVHIHLGVLGFVTLTFVGATYQMLPAALNAALHSPVLARLTLALLPVLLLTLIAGFLTGHLLLDLAAGAGLLAAFALHAYNLVQTWRDAGRRRAAASDHFILAGVFLLLAGGTGMLVTVNALWHPQPMPFGKLHLIAYTHLALVGFVLLTVVGLLAHLLPLDLADERVKSNKKRGAYLAELTAIAERWQALQLGALSLGTIGLALVASLVWQFSMGDWPVTIAAWAGTGLLTFGLVLAVLRVLTILTHHPDSQSNA
jgi:hypothetical protein